MKRLPPITLALVAFGFAAPTPLFAQDGNVAIAYFVTTDAGHVLQLEEGIRGHVGWHRNQNDTWPAFVYQAMTGGFEYVWLSPGHTWADFDSPGVDPQADMTDFVERAGSHTSSVDVRIWSTWQDVSKMPAPDDMVPIWEVIEFDFMSTAEGREALISAFAKIKSAIDTQGLPFQYGINEVESSDSGPELFIAIVRRSFAELDQDDPNGFQRMLTQAYGHADAVHIIRTLEKYLTPKARRFWTLRQDLSYLPGM